MSYFIPPVPAEEDEEWERLDGDLKRKSQQRAIHNASVCAQEFIESLSPAEIGIFTLRKAFEEGFMHGSFWANKNTKGQ